MRNGQALHLKARPSMTGLLQSIQTTSSFPSFFSSSKIFNRCSTPPLWWVNVSFLKVSLRKISISISRLYTCKQGRGKWVGGSYLVVWREVKLGGKIYGNFLRVVIAGKYKKKIKIKKKNKNKKKKEEKIRIFIIPLPVNTNLLPFFLLKLSWGKSPNIMNPNCSDLKKIEFLKFQNHGR
jgi:hypothetical protein